MEVLTMVTGVNAAKAEAKLRKPKKIQDCAGIELMTSTIRPVQRSTD